MVKQETNMSTKATQPHEAARTPRLPESVYQRRRRAVLAVGATLLAPAVLWGIGKRGEQYNDNVMRITGANKAPVTAEPAPTYDYTAVSGDTSWEIAKRVQKVQGDSGDVRPLVDEIEKQTAEDGTPGLQAGDHVKLPVDIDPESSSEDQNE